jgi:hypothetical protein
MDLVVVQNVDGHMDLPVVGMDDDIPDCTDFGVHKTVVDTGEDMVVHKVLLMVLVMELLAEWLLERMWGQVLVLGLVQEPVLETVLVVLLIGFLFWPV